MEATFVLKPEELTPKWVEQLKSRFAEGKPITISASGEEKPRYNPQEVLRKLEEARKKFPPQKISAAIDISKLIDEMYWEGNH